jgi:Protein of unknown function (DUF4245)
MTTTGPTSRSPETPDTENPADRAAGQVPPTDRSARFTYANMLRSLLPLVLICLVLVGWIAFRQGGVDPVRPIDPSSTVRFAAERATYPLVVPTGLADGYRVTSARTDAGNAGKGAPVTLEIGYVTPSTEYAGFVVSDDPRAAPLRKVLDGARQVGTVRLDGATWTRSTTERGETALTRDEGGVTVLVTGSASEQELQTVASAVRPYSG